MDAGDHEYAEGSRAMKEHRYVDAVHYFSKAVFLCPLEPLPYISRAEAYVCLCDARSAVANYRKALSIMEDSASANDLRRRLSQLLDAAGLVAFSAGNTSAAIKLAEEAMAECAHPLISLHHATYLIAVEQWGAAETILRRILDTHPEEVQPEASTLLARLLIATRRDMGGAKALIDEMALQYPNDKSTMQAQQLFTTAFERYRRNAEGALDVNALTRCIDAYPDDCELYYTRAIARCEGRAYTLAVQDLFVCINKSDGTHPEAGAMMSRVLATIGDELSSTDDFTSAIHYYTEALKWCGDAPDAEIVLARGDCQGLLGRHDEALADYTLVYTADPLHEGARSRLGRLHDAQGTAAYNEGNYILAEVEFTRAIEIFDQSADFFFHRALARGMLGKGAMMVRDLISCRDMGTDNPQVIGMINQFCSESTPAEQRHMREQTDEIMKVEEMMAKSREVASNQRRRERTEQRPREDDFQLSSLRTTGKEVLEGGVLTPANIRHFVRNMQMSKTAQVVVHTNAITQQRTINGRAAALVERDARQKPHWEVSQKKVQSRLDKIAVSKPSPIPRLCKYTPQHPATSSTEMARYAKRDDSLQRTPSIALPTRGRRAPLAPMMAGGDGGLGATENTPVLVARQAYRVDTLPSVSARKEDVLSQQNDRKESLTRSGK